MSEMTVVTALPQSAQGQLQGRQQRHGRSPGISTVTREHVADDALGQAGFETAAGNPGWLHDHVS